MDIEMLLKEDECNGLSDQIHYFSPLSNSSSPSVREQLSTFVSRIADKLPLNLPILSREDVASCLCKDSEPSSPCKEYELLNIENSTALNNKISNNENMTLGVSSTVSVDHQKNTSSSTVSVDHQKITSSSTVSVDDQKNTLSSTVSVDHQKITSSSTVSVDDQKNTLGIKEMGNIMKKALTHSWGLTKDTIKEDTPQVEFPLEKPAFEDDLNYEMSDVDMNSSDDIHSHYCTADSTSSTLKINEIMLEENFDSYELKSLSSNMKSNPLSAVSYENPGIKSDLPINKKLTAYCNVVKNTAGKNHELPPTLIPENGFDERKSIENEGLITQNSECLCKTVTIKLNRYCDEVEKTSEKYGKLLSASMSDCTPTKRKIIRNKLPLLNHKSETHCKKPAIKRLNTFNNEVKKTIGDSKKRPSTSISDGTLAKRKSIRSKLPLLNHELETPCKTPAIKKLNTFNNDVKRTTGDSKNCPSTSIPYLRKRTQNERPSDKISRANHSKELKKIQKIDLLFSKDDYYGLVRLLIHQKSDSERSFIGMMVVRFLINKQSFCQLTHLLNCLDQVCELEAALCSVRIRLDMVVFHSENKDWTEAWNFLHQIEHFLKSSFFKPFLYKHPLLVKLAILKVYFYNGNFDAAALILKEERFFINHDNFHLCPSESRELSSITRKLLSDYYFRNDIFINSLDFFYTLVDTQNSLSRPIMVVDLFNVLCANLCATNYAVETLKIFMRVHELNYANSKISAIAYRTLIHTAIKNQYGFKVVGNVIKKATKLSVIYPGCDYDNKIILYSYMSLEEVFAYIIAWSFQFLFNCKDFKETFDCQLEFKIASGEARIKSLNNPNQNWDIREIKKMVSKIAKIKENKLFKPSLEKSPREKILTIENDFNFKFLLSAHQIWTGDKDYSAYFEQNPTNT